MPKSNTTRMSRESLRVSSIEHQGWQAAPGRVPEVGESIFCLDGPAEVVRLLGRTGDGSRLLELRCEDHDQPFFAPSSNVLFKSPPATSSVHADPAVADGA